ncbi:WD40-repeat-containing domain protein [Suillus paluster]|uniref:WD40-repeat-containing domain protein n=1 Tax=Suillus paluster TaxID=48578 RepID=UPI001B876AB1|nr:WD40-repeat-containing domain protein [Suillus paluster]KAG1718617.1 WD40-repeat-containing domain protein [Suillus paluster]
MAARSFERQTLEETSTPAESTRPTPKHEFEGHEGPVWSFVFLHDNAHIVSGSWDGTMRKWNCDTGLLVGEPWKGKGGRIYSLALSPDGKTIACGREDGSVQRWNIEGEMMEGVWKGHSEGVRSLSWSPSGSHLASGSDDGTILIRKVETGKVKVGPIKTKQGWVLALAYSPSGDRIASGGRNRTICIRNTKTGKLVVGPIEVLGIQVRSLVWSSDSSKIYSASDEFARVFDSTSGKPLHRFKHGNNVFSIALSPENNVLACTGNDVAQLWDTESYQPLGQPFCPSFGQPFHHQDHQILCCVSFSRDGAYLAYGGCDKKLTLWMVKDIAPELGPPILQQDHSRVTQQETRPERPSSSCLDADATGGDGIIEDGHDDPYNNFFESSEPSPPSASSGPRLHHLFSARHFRNIISRHRPPANESTPEQCNKHSFFARRLHQNPPVHPTPNQPISGGKARAGEDPEESDQCSANAVLDASKANKDEYDEPTTDGHTPPPDDPTSPAELDSEDNRIIWKWLTLGRGKNQTSATMAPTRRYEHSPEVVDIYAARGFQRYVAMKRVRKTKASAATSGATAAEHVSTSLQAGPSSQVVFATATHASSSSQAGPSSQVVSVQAVSSSQGIAVHGAQHSQGTAGSSHASPSRFVTYHTEHGSDSDSTIEGSCNRFLDRICFPRGHYHDD